MQRRVREIIKKVAADNGLSEEKVRAIYESQFGCAREAAIEGDPEDPATFNNIRIRHLGLFMVRKSQIDKINEARKISETNKSSSD